jgi:hypothetical protein
VGLAGHISETDNGMTMFFNRDTQAHDFSADNAYRAWLISRHDAPIVHHSGDIQWKRFRVSTRQIWKHVRGTIAAVHMALVADKMRRARRELARVEMRHMRSTTQPSRRTAP